MSRTYSFKEISSLTNIKPYVLRFWETEFDEIKPQVDQLGEKNYNDEDVEAIERIKQLLFEEKLSIPEAKIKFYHFENKEENLVDDDIVLSQETYSSKQSPVQALHQINDILKDIKSKNGWN